MTSADPSLGVAPSELTFGDRWRRDWYVARVEWHLDSLVPGRERRRITASLRDDITTESSRHGLHDTLAGLGDPRTLARNYVDSAAPLRPKWSRGIVAAGAALLLYWAVFFCYALGMLAVVDQSSMAHAESQFLFIDVIAFSDASAHGVGWSGGFAWLLTPLIIIAVAFVLASCAWRAGNRRSR